MSKTIIPPISQLNPSQTFYASVALDGTADFFVHSNIFGAYLQNDASVDRTYMGWYKIDDFSTVKAHTLWANWDPRKRSGGGLARGYRTFFQRLSGGDLVLSSRWQETGLGGRALGVQIDVAATNAIVESEWFHVAVVYDADGTSSTRPRAEMFVNGLSPTQSVTIATLLNTDDITSTHAQTGIHWGALITDETGSPVLRTSFLEGNMAEFKMLNHKLTANEIWEYYDSRRLGMQQSRLHESILRSHIIWNDKDGIGPTILKAIEPTAPVRLFAGATGGPVVVGSDNTLFYNSRLVPDVEGG